MNKYKSIPDLKIHYFLKMKVSPFTTDKLHEIIHQTILNRKQICVSNINVHAVNMGNRDKKYLRIHNNFEFSFCDGMGVLWGARLFGIKLPERITYADWLWQLAGFLSKYNYTIYLLGAKSGVAQLAKEKLLERFPDLKIVGLGDGYFEQKAESKIIQEINDCSPNILLVCMGMPRQEFWINKNRYQLKTNVILNGGAALDYVSGIIQRGPDFLTKNGFEWLCRIYYDPVRLWKRYAFGIPYFFMILLKDFIRQKLKKSENTKF